MSTHRTNGCTMRAGRFDEGCGAHGPREDTISYQRPGAVCRTPTDGSRNVDGRGVWVSSRNRPGKVKGPRKPANCYEAMAQRKIAYDAATVCIRKFPRSAGE